MNECVQRIVLRYSVDLSFVVNDFLYFNARACRVEIIIKYVLTNSFTFFSSPASRGQQRPLPDLPPDSHQVLQREQLHMYKEKQLGKVRLADDTLDIIIIIFILNK